MTELAAYADLGVQQHQFSSGTYEPFFRFFREQLAETRRIAWDVRSHNCPPNVAVLAVKVGGIIDQDITEVTGKSYSFAPPDSTAPPESRAYAYHREPPEYIGKLAVLSLSNRAVFFGKSERHPDDIIEHSVICVPGLLLYFPVDLVHKVSAPQFDGEKRYVAVFGTRV